MDNELKNEVYNRVSQLGDNEFRLAYSRSVNKESNEIVELIEEHRKPYTEGRVASIGAMVMASAETWQRIAEESEAAAKRELLANSAVLTELTELERKAREAQEAADKKNRELQAIWSEWNAIPDRLEAKELQLAQISNEIRSLDPQSLKAEFKTTYLAMLEGAIASGSFLPDIAMRLYTSDIRLEVLNTKAEELEHEIVELKARQKVLAKKLGQRI